MLGFGFNKTKVLASAERYVQQGKLQNAIAEYEKIIREDPKDLTVLNTIGDLYSRIGQVESAISYFKTVGDHYASQGFTLKAIAMYKKLTKASPGATDCVAKLAELYTQQGLYNDARQQYMIVADAALKHNKVHEAAKIFEKILEFDAENGPLQSKLADLYVRINKKDDARNIYMRAAESLHQRGQIGPAQEALGRVLTLDPTNALALQMQARIAIGNGDPNAAISLFEKIADLDSRPDALRTMLDACLHAGRLEDAEPVAKKLLSVHNDLSGLSSYAETLLAAGQLTKALSVYEEHAEQMLAANSPALTQTLNGYISRAKEDPDALERLYKLFLKAGDTTHSAELSELLAHAYVQKGELARARDLYQELAALEPENPLHAQNYKQIVAKLGEDATTRQLSSDVAEQALMIEELEVPDATLEQHYPEDVTAAIQAALTESELFDSYNVPAKAIAPLETVLTEAPQDVRVNQRLAALYARAGRNADAARCCAVLEKVFSAAGHSTEAGRYAEMAATYAGVANVSVPTVEDFTLEQISPAVEPPATTPFSISPETTKSSGEEGELSWDSLPLASDEEETVATAHDATPSVTDFEIPSAPEPTASVVEFELSRQASEKSVAGQSHEFDLSDEWEAMAQPAPEAIPAAEPTALKTSSDEVEAQQSAEITDTMDEVQFYISQSMWDEARAALDKLTRLDPNCAEIPAYHAAIEAGSTASQQAAEIAEFEFESVSDEPEPTITQPIVTEEPVSSDARIAEFAFDESATVQQPAPAQPAPFVAEPSPVLSAASAKIQPPAAADDDILGGFVSDLEDSLGDEFVLGNAPTANAAPAPIVAPPTPVPVAPVAPRVAAPAAQAAAAAPALAPLAEIAEEENGLSALSDLFDEFKDDVESSSVQAEDPETHYNLGVAFKEMGLLDEAIGELQKVCQAIDQGAAFSQSMQAYTWLAGCFVEKGVPEASFRWYQRALDLASTDDVRTAIHYELACAYETAGQKPQALQHFMEVYTSNIDFRDVAERIKGLKS